MTKFGSGLLVDTGYFFALYDDRDKHHQKAREQAAWLDKFPIVLPWPVLYETVNTRFSRRADIMERFHRIVEAGDTTLLDDAPYRSGAYDAVLLRTRTGKPLSLVDAVLQSVIEDPNVAVEAMLTFNYRDFAEVCAVNSVELL